MSHVVFSPAARADLEGIWDHSIKRWGREQGERYLRMLQAACGELAAGTKLSRGADDIRPGYRKADAGSHILFFQATDDRIDIVRILHRRMDPTRHLEV